MPTWHGDDGSRGSEQILAADWTIIVHGVWVASVRGGPGYGNTHIAPLHLCQHKSSKRPRQILPCNGRSLFPSPRLFCRYRNPGNGRSSSCCCCPIACRCRNSSTQIPCDSCCSNLRPFVAFRMPCRACSACASGPGDGLQRHRDSVGTCTSDDIQNTAPLRSACSAGSPEQVERRRRIPPRRPHAPCSRGEPADGTLGWCPRGAGCTGCRGRRRRRLI
jgi:hypothetical protein